MTVSSEDDLTALKRICSIVANTLEVMGNAIEPGMTTLELDAIGRKLLDDAGALPARSRPTDSPARPVSASTRRSRTASPARAEPSRASNGRIGWEAGLICI